MLWQLMTSDDITLNAIDAEDPEVYTSGITLVLMYQVCRNSGPDIVFGIIVLLNQNCCLSSGVRLPFPAQDRTGS